MVYKRYMSRFLLPIVAIALLFTSCAGIEPAAPQSRHMASSETPASVNSEEHDLDANPIRTAIDQMDLHMKTGQLFLVEVRHPQTGHLLTEINDEFRVWAHGLQPGGYILFADNLVSPGQTRKLIQDLRNTTVIPPFIAIDEEGGIVSRLNAVPGMNAIPAPTARVIGNLGQAKKAEETGKTIARQLKDLGFSVNFAPVADIHIPGTGGSIGDRSYGTEAQIVSTMAGAFSKALEDGGILSVAKHFPGHGAAYGDSHTQKTVLKASQELMMRRELVPFAHLIDQGIGGIMTGHIIVPSMDSSKNPASLSQIITRNLLREGLHYNGLIFTDSLRMGGVTSFYDSVELPRLAFEAGADILLMPVSALKSRDRLLEALETGKIPEQRLSESLARIAAAKQKFLVSEKTPAIP